MKKRTNGPPLEGYYPYLVFLFLGFCVADLAMIPLRTTMLPTEIPPSHAPRNQQNSFASPGSFSSITSRNLFSRDGTIPDALALKQKKAEGQEIKEAPPVPSNLPLNLIGTIVHSNPQKSIANIEVKSKSNTVIAVRVGKEIEGLATLVSVERGKAIIRNTSNQRLEFIEIKNLTKLSFASAKPVTTAKTGKEEVRQTGQNKFEISRSDVLKYTGDMSAVLQQAAMQPRRKANGEIDGFKFLNIQPNSIYTQLGFQIGDVIKSVDGVPVTSPAQALEMYNAMKNNASIKLGIERDGRDQEMDYSIRQ